MRLRLFGFSGRAYPCQLSSSISTSSPDRRASRKLRNDLSFRFHSKRFPNAAIIFFFFARNQYYRFVDCPPPWFRSARSRAIRAATEPQLTPISKAWVSVPMAPLNRQLLVLLVRWRPERCVSEVSSPLIAKLTRGCFARIGIWRHR